MAWGADPALPERRDLPVVRDDARPIIFTWLRAGRRQPLTSITALRLVIAWAGGGLERTLEEGLEILDQTKPELYGMITWHRQPGELAAAPLDARVTWRLLATEFGAEFPVMGGALLIRSGGAGG